MEIGKRVDKIEERLDAHERGIQEQAKVSQKILDKISRLVYIEENSRNLYEHHTLLCTAIFDKRYVDKESFQIEVEKIVYDIGDKNVKKNTIKSTLIANIGKITWNIILMSGIIFMVINSLSQ